MNFTAKLTAELTERLEIVVRFGTSDHPQSNDIVERQWDGTLKGMLHHVMNMERTETAMFIVCRGLTAKSNKISQVFRRSNSCMAVHLMPP